MGDCFFRASDKSLSYQLIPKHLMLSQHHRAAKTHMEELCDWSMIKLGFQIPTYRTIKILVQQHQHFAARV